MEESDRSFVCAMNDFAKNDSFAALMRLLMERPMLYRDFELLSMPCGADPAQMWDLLSTLRKHMGVCVPYADRRGRMGWYSITAELREMCAKIDALCGVGSWLARAMEERNPFFLLLEEVTGELIAAMKRDGLDASYETLRSVVCGQTEASGTTIGRLAANMLDVLHDRNTYAVQRIDEAMVIEIRRRIGEGLDDLPKTRPLPQPGAPFAAVDVTRADSLAKIASIAEGVDCDPYEHPLVMMLGIDGLFATCLPFSHLNNCTSMIVTCIYLIQRGLPVLSLAPIRRTIDEWRQGLRVPDSTRATLGESVREVDGSFDFTVHISASVEMVYGVLQMTAERVLDVIEKEDSLFEALEKDPLVNHRQRAIILQSMRDVTSTFRIASHQRATHVAYATARADLVGLTEMGLFDCMSEGRAYVFVPRPDIAQCVRRRWLKE